MQLGETFRQEVYADDPCGLLRLHSTFRHDLKIYSSDEGRVQETAASFTKGLLALEGADITPIMVRPMVAPKPCTQPNAPLL